MNTGRVTTIAEPCPLCGGAGCVAFATGEVVCDRFSPAGGKRHHEEWSPVPDAWLDPFTLYPGGRVFAKKDLLPSDRRHEKPPRSDAEIKKARALWDECAKIPTTSAAAYFGARGVPVSHLPLPGKVPAAIRCHPALAYWHQGDDGKPVELVKSPCVVGAIRDATRADGDQIIGCQRIWLDPDDPSKKRRGVEAKKAVGKTNGGAVELGNDRKGPDRFPDGVLVLCEGLETGMAILAATGYTTWACVSTNGLKTIEIPPEWIADAEPVITSIVIAADHDRLSGQTDRSPAFRPGYRAALYAARRLRRAFERVPISIAVPTHADCPALITSQPGVDGFDELAEGHKTADWLDVLIDPGHASGRNAVLEGLSRARVMGKVERLELAVPAGEVVRGDDDEPTRSEPRGADAPAEPEESDGPILPRGSLARARVMLDELWTPRTVAGSRWNIAYHIASDRWLEWVGTHYRTVHPTELRTSMLARFEKFRLQTKDGRKIRVAMSARQCGDVLEAIIADAGIAGDQLPCWCPATFDGEGRAVYVNGTRPDAAAPEREPTRHIPYQNGLLRLDLLLSEGRVVVEPATNRYVIPYCLPYPIPDDELRTAMQSDEQAGQVLGRLCPRWMRFLSEVSDGDERWVSCLGRFLGYCLTDDTRFQKSLFLIGQPGAGKGTILDVLHLLVGPDSVLSSSFRSLTERFEMGALVGKLVLQLDEAAVGWSTDSIEASRVFKTLTGGAMVTPEQKHRAKGSSYRPVAKVVATANELPKLPEASGATSRRILILPFNTSFGDKADPTLRDKLAAEIGGICIWALLHLRELYREGHFPEPSEGVELREDFRRLASPVYAFVKDCCVFDPGSEVDTRLMASLFAAWCETEGVNAMSAEKFGTMLRVVNASVRRMGRKTLGRRWKAYTGIRPRVPSDDDQDGSPPESVSVRDSNDCAEFDFPFEWYPDQARSYQARMEHRDDGPGYRK